MHKVPIGRIKDPQVKEWVEAFLVGNGLSPTLARYHAVDELSHFGDLPVFALDGAPFMDCEGVYIPFASNHYEIYQRLYKPIILRNGGSHVPGLFYPMLPTDVDCEGYLKFAKTFRSHMIGEKSKRIQWRVTTGKPFKLEMYSIKDYMSSWFQAHVLNMEQRYSLDPLESSALMRGWHMFPGLQDETGYMVGYDQDELCIVAAMQLYFTGHHIDCHSIATKTDEKYKPYSLINCAQIATGLYAINHGIKTVNFGLNPPGMGDYKELFAHMEPVMGLSAPDNNGH